MTSACSCVSILPAARKKAPVLAGVGMDLRAVQRDRAHLKQAHLARQKQNLHEQRLDLLQKALAERCDSVVIGMIVAATKRKATEL